jgi:CHAT domain-containing protein
MMNPMSVNSKFFSLCLTVLLPLLVFFEATQVNAQTEGNQSDLTNLSDVNPIPEIRDTDPPIELLDSNISRNVDSLITAGFVEKFGDFYGVPATTGEIRSELGELASATGTNPALVYAIKSPQGLLLVLVTSDQSENTRAQAPATHSTSLIASAEGELVSEQSDEFSGDVIFKMVSDATSPKLDQVSKTFRREVSDPANLGSKNYLQSSQQLYNWIIRPLDADLKVKGVDTLIFVMDEGLRAIPVAALHDGSQFLVEEYNLSIIPSFSLTDTRYQSIRGTEMLGMGITESVEGLSALPSVGVELPTLTQKVWQGQSFLNETATLDQLTQLSQQKQFDIIHLATHAEFNSGNFNRSFIQLWDQKVGFADLRQVADGAKWAETPTIELLVLSACSTALGSKDAELGFTGLALQTGIKSVLGSLWYVSDEGTLALMGEFYDQLNKAPIKSAALREAQLSMLNGETVLEDNIVKFANGLAVSLPNTTGVLRNNDYRHPYYWSSFTLVGNWN